MNRKRNRIKMLLALGVTLAVFPAGCGEKSDSAADYIGTQAAKEVVLKEAGFAAEEVSFSSVELECEGDVFYYEVVFAENGTEHEYEVDALTGAVTGERHKLLDAGAAGSQSEGNASSAAGEDDAGVAGSQSGGNASAGAGNGDAGAADLRGGEDMSSAAGAAGSQSGGNASDASSGAGNVAGGAAGTQSGGNSGGVSDISSEEALSIALGHAGLTADEVRSSQVKLDVEDGVNVFDVEFRSVSGTDYDYEVNAADGAIHSFEIDAEDSHHHGAAQGAGTISEEQAIACVLGLLPDAKEDEIAAWLDTHDGRARYVCSLTYDEMRHEIELDAASGDLLKWEAKRLY